MPDRYITTLEKTIIKPLSPAMRQWGTITQIKGQSVNLEGLSDFIGLGDLISSKNMLSGKDITGEVISVEGRIITAMMFSDPAGLRVGQKAYIKCEQPLCPSEQWIGNTLNYRGETIEGHVPRSGATPIKLKGLPPPAILRKALGPRLTTGVAAIDTFLPICQGQRMGLFAGSGVGKSTLLATLAKSSNADINIIALIGERGREVRHFVEHTLGPEGMKKTILFVATSDEPSAMKLRTALLAIATAEYFRDAGKQVLFLFDSLTRYAEAHRDVALSAGEVPSLRAYPPSTFRALAALCERAGPGIDGVGDISAIFSVLVAGSDMEEPVADMVRGILDGHVILDREIAERGRYPAINLRRSVSRSLPNAATPEENKTLMKARGYISNYEDAQTLIRAGLYVPGSDIILDQAVNFYPELDDFISKIGAMEIKDWFTQLNAIMTPADQET